MSYTALIRAAYGTILLCAPGAVARTVSGEPAASETASLSLRVAGRILGLRQLVQALVLDGGGRARLIGGTAVDALHALSMADIIVCIGGEYRRPAAFEAALATALAAGGLKRARDA